MVPDEHVTTLQNNAKIRVSSRTLIVGEDHNTYNRKTLKVSRTTTVDHKRFACLYVDCATTHDAQIPHQVEIRT